MLDGTIDGGWGYVITVYVFTWFCLVSYTASVARRLRKDGEQ